MEEGVKESQSLTQNASSGAAALAMTVYPKKLFKLISLALHLSAAAANTENFVVTLHSGQGSTYIPILYSRDLSVGSVQDLYVEFGDNYIFSADDHIDVAWANAGTKTYSCIVTTEAV